MQGQRIARAFFQPQAEDATLALEPVSRDERLIFTPRNAAMCALLAWQSSDFQALYDYLGVNARSPSAQMPSLGEFVQELSREAVSLLSFHVSGGSVSPEGLRATVVVDLQYGTDAGERVRLTGVPLSLFRENGDWKVSYDDLRALMERK